MIIFIYYEYELRYSAATAFSNVSKQLNLKDFINIFSFYFSFTFLLFLFFHFHSITLQYQQQQQLDAHAQHHALPGMQGRDGTYKCSDGDSCRGDLRKH